MMFLFGAQFLHTFFSASFPSQPRRYVTLCQQWPGCLHIYNNVYSSSSSFRTGWKEMSGQVSFFREKVNQKSALRDNTTICIIFRLQNYYIFLFGCYTILSVNDIIMQKCIILLKKIVFPAAFLC